MPEKIVLLNDLEPELDRNINGYFYDQENENTGVIYRILNVTNGKSYIGRAYSYKTIKNRQGNTKKIKHGARGRFRVHWGRRSKVLIKDPNVCPVFSKALLKSDIHDWYIFTLKVCPIGELKEQETELIKEHNTSDPEFGYNIFVGNNKPNSKEHLAKYQKAKIETNIRRAQNGEMKRTEHNKKLPTYISYYPVKENGKLREGYMARIKINGKVYKKIFTSMKESMESKLEMAKKYIQLIKQHAAKVTTKKYSGSKTSNKLNPIIRKGASRTREESKNLPTNIRYYTSKSKNGTMAEGYSVEIVIDGKRYKKVFTSMNESMEYKLEKAEKQLELFKSHGTKGNDIDLSMTKGPERKSDKGKNLPINISYHTSKDRHGKILEGYLVQIVIDKKKYRKVFISMAKSMKYKLQQAKKQLQIFKSNAKNTQKKYSGSKTSKLNTKK